MNNQRKELLKRQITDIISQADKIEKGDYSSMNFENYSRYSNELKKYINQNVTEEHILKLNNEIPVINYARNELEIWHFILFPIILLNLYKNYYAKGKTMSEIKISKNKFSSIEFLSHSIKTKES